MASLFAPEINDIGPSAFTKGQEAPSNIDYSGLFETLNTLAEPKKVSEKELKDNAVKKLTYDLSKIDAMEDKTQQQAAYRMARRTARANYGLDEKDVTDIFAQFTGELPFAEKTVQELNNDIIMKAYEEDPEMSIYLPTNWAESGGDPDKFMSLSMASYHNTIGRRAQLDAKKKEIDVQNLADSQKSKAFKEELISTLQIENNKLLTSYMKLSPEILKQEGLEGLSGVELYSRLSSSVTQLEMKVRNAARTTAAQNGEILTKEEEDRAVAGFLNTSSFFANMTEETQKALTAKNAEEMAILNASLPPELRPLQNNPEYQSIAIEHAFGGRVGLATQIKESNRRFKIMTENRAGLLDPASLNTNNAGGIDMSVEGPADSLSTVQAKYKNVFAPEGLASVYKYNKDSKLAVIGDIRDSIQNPVVIDNYSKATLNAVAKNFMYGYALALPELDTKGEFTKPKAIEVMFGSKALAYADALTKKMPVEAPDIWNKINVMSDVTADRVLINLKQNLDVLNQDAFGTPYQNPFVFTIDETGVISGSISPQAVSKNSYIKKVLNNYDVVNLNNIDQPTFWKIMKDYSSVFDNSNYAAVEESVKSLEILARVTSKVPEANRRENALNTINMGLSQLVSARNKSFIEMTPEEFTATTTQGTPRSRLVQGNQ